MMNIASIYPKGIEKGRNLIGNNTTICPKLKRKALAMLDRDVSLNLTAKKLKLDPSTISMWIQPAERY